MHSYPKIWHLGHKNVVGMTEGKLVIQEKYDGSQFSFEIIEGKLWCKGRRADIDVDAPESQFGPTVRHLQAAFADIVPGWVYRGEAFRSHKHNTKVYDRIPKGHLVLFDIETSPHEFLPPEDVRAYARLLGVEPAREMPAPTEDGIQVKILDELLDTESSLGNGKVEGVVFKNYYKQTPWGEPMFAKFVSEEFKESHKKNLDWKQGKDLHHALGSQFAIEGRWRKGVQRLRDSGDIEGSPKDIGLLLRELSLDLLDEHGDELKERVWKEAWKKISKAANAGFPEWYKRELAFGPTDTGEVGGGQDENNRRDSGTDDRDVERSEQAFENEGGPGAIPQGDGDSGTE